jgi:hypothetical protein
MPITVELGVIFLVSSFVSALTPYAMPFLQTRFHHKTFPPSPPLKDLGTVPKGHGSEQKIIKIYLDFFLRSIMIEI